VGGQQVGDESELAVAMIVYDPGETVTLAVYREGTLIDVEVTLGSA
jgi:S1-C subfamily serine protease